MCLNPLRACQRKHRAVVLHAISPISMKLRQFKGFTLKLKKTNWFLFWFFPEGDRPTPPVFLSFHQGNRLKIGKMYEALTAMAFNQLLWEFAHIFLHFKNFVYSEMHAKKKKKKKQIPNGMSKHFIHWLIYALFYSSPRKKQNWKNRRIGQMNYNVFNKELVS